jgi:hypothetical protein
MSRRFQGRAGVSKIITKCPVTEQPIDTGIEIDETSFSLLPDFVGKIFCPNCRAEHEWSKLTASVVDNERPKP